MLASAAEPSGAGVRSGRLVVFRRRYREFADAMRRYRHMSLASASMEGAMMRALEVRVRPRG